MRFYCHTFLSLLVTPEFYKDLCESQDNCQQLCVCVWRDSGFPVIVNQPMCVSVSGSHGSHLHVTQCKHGIKLHSRCGNHSRMFSLRIKSNLCGWFKSTRLVRLFKMTPQLFCLIASIFFSSKNTMSTTADQPGQHVPADAVRSDHASLQAEILLSVQDCFRSLN